MQHHPVQVTVDRHNSGLIQSGTDAPQRFTYQQGPSLEEDNPKFKSEIEKSTVLSQLTFAYVFRVIKKAFMLRKSPVGIQDPDLTTFPYKRRAEVLEERFQSDYNRQKAKHPNKKPSLTWAIIRSTKWDILRCIVVALMFSFVRIFTGWVLKKLIDAYSISSGKSFEWSGYIAACLVVGFFLEHHYNHIGTYFPVHVRGGLISMLYSKVNKLSLYTLTKISPGQILNIASNDVNVFDEFGVYFPKLLVAPIIIVAAGALLWIFWGVLCLVGLGYIVMWFPLQALYIVQSEKTAEHKNQISDDRVKLTRESIEGIRLLKMYTWELRFKKEIFDLRNKETHMLRNLVVGESLWRGLSFSSLGIATFLIFFPSYLVGHEFTAGKVFATYYIFAFLRLYGGFFVNQGFIFLVQAGMTISKIEKVLETTEIGDITFEAPQNPENEIEFDKFNGYWAKGSEDVTHDSRLNVDINKKEVTAAPTVNVMPTIKDITVNMKKGSLTALVGAVGSGKTSFLMSLTGEMPKTTGSLRFKGTIAYVEQEPTIFAGTFRESICFGKPYEPEFYKKVIKACNLETDLSLFPKGDMSEIGERGNNLSGGQKARLALARGVYANADIYLLDDPLSAVDPKVAASIFNNCIAGILRGKTVILVTHQVDFAKSCDNVLLMKEGRVMGSGPFDQIQDHNGPENKELWISKKKSAERGVIVPKKLDSAVVLQKTLQRHSTDHQATINNAPAATTTAVQQDKPAPEAPPSDESQQDQYPGVVNAKTYFRLLRGMGSSVYLLLLFGAFIAVEMTNIAYGRILGTWLDGTFADWKSMAILGGLVGFFIVIYFVKYVMLNVGLVRTTKSHHEKMLNRIVQAPVYFYDSNPVGQILNRFSNDTGTLDRFLPLIAMDVLDNIFFIGSVIIFVAITDPVHLGPLAGEVIFVLVMMKICHEGVKQTKKYEMATKGPLFSLLSASLSGIVIIRSYGQSEVFKKKFATQLHSSIKGSVGFALTSRFLAFYIDMGYNLAEIGVIFITAGRNTIGGHESIDGFVLALILSVSGVLQYALRQYCMSSILLESAARIQSYWEVPNEAPLVMDKDKELEAQKWPQKGDIEFNHVFMRYSPTGPNVIKDLTLKAEAGQRIGCVGRTGAGKTSILQLLFRLQEVNKETNKDGYITIDGVDTSNVGLHELRGNISIIPQTPFILTGTVRYNVDPLGKASDEEIWKALKDVRLKKHVENLPQQLDTQMTAATSVFSVGQKQLICLARSILKPSNIMIMDEATANMDQETDNYVTNKIRETFTHATTFTIAHRLSTIANYDRVLVLDKGQIKEFDEPYKLLVKKIGDLEMTNEAGHFASMVKNTGPVTSKHIFDITLQAYNERHGRTTQGGNAIEKPKGSAPKEGTIILSGGSDNLKERATVATLQEEEANCTVAQER